MKKRVVFFLFMCVVCLLSSIVISYADEIMMTVNQTDYYFVVGEDALIELELDSSMGEAIDGMLSYTITQEINQQGFSYSSTNTRSSTMTVEDGMSSVMLGFGTSDSPLQLTVGLKYVYDDKSTVLDDIRIFFVEDEEQKQNSQSQSQSKTTQESQETDQSNDEEYKVPEPKQSKSQQALQNSQIAQDSSALKKQMEKEVQEKDAQDTEFGKTLAENDELNQMHDEMLKSGFNQTGASVRSSSNASGSFEFEYTDESGNTEKISGKMEGGELTEMINTLQMKEELERNDEYNRLKNDLEDKGFFPDEFEAKDENAFLEKFADGYNNSITVSGEGFENLSDIRNFNIDESLSVGYVLGLLEKDIKFKKMNDNLIDLNYSLSGINMEGENSYAEYVKGDDSRRIYFSEPVLFYEKSIFDWMIDMIQLGFSFMFKRG